MRLTKINLPFLTLVSSLLFGSLPSATASAYSSDVTMETIKLKITGVQNNPHPAVVLVPTTGIARIRVERFKGMIIEQDINVQVASLTPGNYSIRANGSIIVTSFKTDSTGAADVMIRDEAIPQSIQPVTKVSLIEVLDSSRRVVLTGRFKGASVPGRPTIMGRAELTSSDKNIKGVARYVVRPIGNAVEQLVIVEIHNMYLRPQPYLVRFISSTQNRALGAITVNRLGRGIIVFTTNPGRNEFDCEARLADDRFPRVQDIRVIEIYDRDTLRVFARGQFKRVTPTDIKEMATAIELSGTQAESISQAQGRIRIMTRARDNFVEGRIDVALNGLNSGDVFDIEAEFDDGTTVILGSVTGDADGSSRVRFTNFPYRQWDTLLPEPVQDVTLIRKLTIRNINTGEAILRGTVNSDR